MVDKSAVFIDGGYLSKLTKEIFKEKTGVPLKINLQKFSNFLADNCDSVLLRAYYYDCPPYQSFPPTEDERKRKTSFDRFEYALKKLDNFEFRAGKLIKYFDKDSNPIFEQKGVDVRLAIDALRLALKGKIDKAILVTGDSDFIPVISAMKDEGVQVILFYHELFVHRQLLECCDKKIIINSSLIFNSKQVEN